MSDRRATSARRCFGGVALVAAAVAILCGLAARHPLEGTTRAEALRQELAERLGAQVSLGRARLRPERLAVVVEDLQVDFETWQLVFPELVVRPSLRSLSRAQRGLAVSGRGFRFRSEAPDALGALVALRALRPTHPLPELQLRLEGGRVESAAGTALLDDLAIRLRRGGDAARLTLDGRQRGGGRLDVRGRLDTDGPVALQAFPQDLALGDAQEWLERLGLTTQRAQPLTASGSSHIEVDIAGRARHAVELQIRDAGGPGLALRVGGEIRMQVGEGGASGLAPGTQLAIAGPVGRIVGQLGATGPEVSLAGPIALRVEATGRPETPRLRARLDLDDAHLGVGGWLRKPSGVAGRLVLDSRRSDDLAVPASFSPAVAPGRRALAQVELDLGPLRLRAERRGAAAWQGFSRWTDVVALADLFPALADRASGGRLRLRHFEAADLDGFQADVEIDAAALGGRRAPFAVDGVAGRARLTAHGFDTEGLVATLEGVPLRVDLAARFPRDGEAMRLRFAAQAGVIDLDQLGVSPAVPIDGSDLPPALVSVAEEPVALLRRERDTLAGIEVERGEIRVGRLRAGEELVEDLELRMALEELRIGIAGLGFRRDGRSHRYAGSIDLNPLVPRIDLGPPLD